MSNWRIMHVFRTLSPLSHIAEAISTTSYLVEEPIVQPDGTIEKVFCYSGNAWRGQLRDLAATYLLEKLGNPTMKLDAFHLLYSGGSIGGAQQTDLEKARRYRQILTPVALFGGGIGSQVLPGKLRISNFYPVCREAPPSFVTDFEELRETISYRDLTFEKSFTRKDDTKDDRINAPLLATPTDAQAMLLAEPEAPAEEKKEKKEPAQQMRMTSELLIAGTILRGHIDLLDASEVELGCLVSALHLFSRSPHIGGQASRGHGLVSLSTTLVDLDSGEIHSFLDVTDRSLLSEVAIQAKDAYDQHVRSLYDAMLASQDAEIRQMIGAPVDRREKEERS